MMTRPDTAPTLARSAVLPAVVALLVSIGGLAVASWDRPPGPWSGALVLLGVLSLAMRSAIRLWQTRAFRLGWFVTTLSCLGLTLLGGGLGVFLRCRMTLPEGPGTLIGVAGEHLSHASSLSRAAHGAGGEAFFGAGDADGALHRSSSDDSTAHSAIR
jgi:hypothetical protein